MTRTGADFDRSPPGWLATLLEVGFVLVLAALTAAVLALI